MQRDQERHYAQLQGSTDSHGATATANSQLKDGAKYQRKYYSKNRAKVKARIRAWRTANREKYNAYMRELRRKKKKIE
jgi:hypothetical protein